MTQTLNLDTLTVVLCIKISPKYVMTNTDSSLHGCMQSSDI